MKNINNKMQIIGEITFTGYRQDNPILRAYNKMLWGMFKAKILSRKGLNKLYAKGRKTQEQTDYNLIANVGFNVMAKILTGDYMDTGMLNYMALGDGVGTPSTSDVALFNEIYRNPTASSTTSNNIAIATAFFTEVEYSGIIKEFGSFIDATGLADSGILWSKIQVDWNKTADESLTIQCKYSFLNKS